MGCIFFFFFWGFALFCTFSKKQTAIIYIYIYVYICRTRNGIFIFKCIDVKFSHIVIIRDVGVLSCGFGYMRHISNLLSSLEGVIVAGDVRHDGTFIRFWSVD